MGNLQHLGQLVLLVWLRLPMDPMDIIRDGKVHRYFRATQKLSVPNLVSHITQRAAGRAPLFIEADDYLDMLVLLKEVSARYSLRVFAFCLMPNHLHLLISPTQENLYDAMKFLFSRYAMRFNKKYERKGHLFGSPYRQAICLDDSYLLAASLYIHLNPMKAGLVKNPSKYRWSSCMLYHEEDAPQSFLEPNFILNMLADDNPSAGRKIYRDLLKEGKKLEVQDPMEKQDAVEGFLSKLSPVISKVFHRSPDRKNNVMEPLGFEFASMDELEKLIQDAGRSKWQRSPVSREAKRYLIQQLIARGFKRTEVAKRLGISRKTVYNILKSPAAGP